MRRVLIFTQTFIIPEKFVLSVEGPSREAFESSLKKYKQELENKKLLRITIPHPSILKSIALGLGVIGITSPVYHVDPDTHI